MMLCFSVCFFFFKQKTAYEMRISDWSSDVCSSDLLIYRSRNYCHPTRSYHVLHPRRERKTLTEWVELDHVPFSLFVFLFYMPKGKENNKVHLPNIKDNESLY